MAADPVDQLADHQHERVHADDVQADHGEDVGLLVVVAHHDVAGQVHHAGHHGEARKRGEHRRGDAGPTQDLAQRRGRRRGRAGLVRLLERQRDRPRVGPDQQGDDHPDHCDPGRCQPGDDERVEREVLPGEQRAEDEWAEHGAEQRAEEHVGDRPSATLGADHVRRRRPREQDRAVHRTDGGETDHDDHGAVGLAAERGHHAAEGADAEAAGDHGHAADAVHQASGGQCGQRSRGEEDRRPEPEDRLDVR